MAHFEIFRKNMFLKKNSFNFLCVNFDTLYTKYTFNMAKCQNLLFLLAPAVWSPDLMMKDIFIDFFGRKMQIFASFLHITFNRAGFGMNGIHTLTPEVFPVSLIPILTGV